METTREVSGRQPLAAHAGLPANVRAEVICFLEVWGSVTGSVKGPFKGSIGVL